MTEAREQLKTLLLNDDKLCPKMKTFLPLVSPSNNPFFSQVERQVVSQLALSYERGIISRGSAVCLELSAKYDRGLRVEDKAQEAGAGTPSIQLRLKDAKDAGGSWWRSK